MTEGTEPAETAEISDYSDVEMTLPGGSGIHVRGPADVAVPTAFSMAGLIGMIVLFSLAKTWLALVTLVVGLALAAVARAWLARWSRSS